ncbi:BnaCnng17650D [Brassica napus]|uniref:BnaA01g21760D protein n=1 Tax=Brassica napus TaxID=3708 RepID=A0A078IHV4_BRANA|nr:BnaA01g21760D [Brassica napus]CDY49541.1 BnaCnng17650D [Brassica napus]
MLLVTRPFRERRRRGCHILIRMLPLQT